MDRRSGKWCGLFGKSYRIRSEEDTDWIRPPVCTWNRAGACSIVGLDVGEGVAA